MGSSDIDQYNDQGDVKEFQKVLGWFQRDSSAAAEFLKRSKEIANSFADAGIVNTEDVEERVVAARFCDSSIPVGTFASKNAVNGYVDQLERDVIKDSIHVDCPRMIGHMTSALPSYMPAMASLLTSLNQNVVKVETAKTVTFLEREALAQLHRLIFSMPQTFYEEHIQMPDVMLGLWTSGGTVANLTALWLARNCCLPSVSMDGFTGALMKGGYVGAVVIGSTLMHYSMDKAADILGIGQTGLIKVATDENFRVDMNAMRCEIERCRSNGILVLAIVGIAGTTETGAVDPLCDMADLAASFNVHFHVDAAWGGSLIFSPQHRHIINGIERADSVTMDAHKQLFLPIGSGLVFLRDPSVSHAIQKTANYIIRSGSFDLGRFTAEGSRPACALLLHTNLCLLGLKGFEALVDHGIFVARYMARKLLRSHNFELLVKPMANILLYRWIPKSKRNKLWSEDESMTEEDTEYINKLNCLMQEQQRSDGRTFVSRTTITCSTRYPGQNIVALRVVIGNPLTTPDDIDVVLQRQMEIVPNITDDYSHTPDLILRPTISEGSEDDEQTWRKYWECSMIDTERAMWHNNVNAFLESLSVFDCK